MGDWDALVRWLSPFPLFAANVYDIVGVMNHTGFDINIDKFETLITVPKTYAYPSLNSVSNMLGMLTMKYNTDAFYPYYLLLFFIFYFIFILFFNFIAFL